MTRTNPNANVGQPDNYTPYETGLTELLNRMGQDHPRCSEALIYQQRLTENIKWSRRYGNTDERQAERSEIIDHLNELSLSVLGTSFNELYGLATSVTGREPVTRLFSRYRGLVGLVVLLEISLSILFFLYKDRLLFSWWAYLATAILLASMTWSWVHFFRSRTSHAPQWRSFVVASALTVTLVAVLGLQVWTALFANRLPPSKFGIAVAMFGDGPDLRITRRGREITSLLRDHLEETIGSIPELSENVGLTSIGVVRTVDQGLADGKRVGAKLVIWGQILEGSESVVIHFQVLQIPAMTDNPSFPYVIPITRHPSLQTSVDLETVNSLEVKQIASQQCLAITGFSLGLYYYFEPDYQDAVKQFKVAVDQLQVAPDSTEPTDLGLVYYYLGKSDQMLGRFEASQEMFNLAAGLHPEDPAIALGQMYNYRVMGQKELEQEPSVLTWVRQLCSGN